MPTLSYTIAALADLAKITRAIIGNNGPLVADRVIQEIETSLMHVATYPRVGRKRSQISKGLLSWPVSSCLALYRPRDDGIEVVRIVYGGRRITCKMLTEP